MATKPKYHFSHNSLKHLDTCDSRLQRLARLVLKYTDCAVIEGHRDIEKQNEYYRQGLSHVRYPDSTHNKTPSLGIHLVPYHADREKPIDWDNKEEFYLFGGFVLGIAAENGIPIRYGGDWDGDGNPRNQTLHDLAHFELLEE